LAGRGSEEFMFRRSFFSVNTDRVAIITLPARLLRPSQTGNHSGNKHATALGRFYNDAVAGAGR
jgi:hypothetical protein